MTTHARPAVALDHVALVPGDLLVLRERWQPVLDGLPVGEVLVVLPPAQSPLRATMLLVATFLQALGHRVTQLEAERFRTPPPRETQAPLL